MFVIDDLVAWLLGLLADSGRKGLTTLVSAGPVENALRSAAEEAVRLTAVDVNQGRGVDAIQMAMVLGQVFRSSAASAVLAGHGTLLEGLQSAIATQLAVLDDANLTGIGRSSSDLLGVTSAMLADSLTAHLVREVVERGSGGGPLFPLATQLNHDVTHLQGGQLYNRVGTVLALLQAGRPAEQRRPPGRPVRLTQPRPVLAGREGLLDVLDVRLSSGHGATPRRLVLCGLGGVGKTSLALAYAYRRLADTSVIWQFEAEEPTALVAGFGDLAAQLGVLGTGDPVAQVHAVLAERPGGWLLIFDNAPDPAALQGVLPPAGDGQVLVTSRNPDWPGDGLEVPVLTRDEATGFLMSRTDSADNASALELAVDTLATRAQLAVFTGLSGRPTAARDQLAVLLPVVEQLLGQEARQALDTRGALAFWTGMAGDAAAARDQFAELLPLQERVHGWEHPETLKVRGDLASWTGKAGDPVTARNQYAQLLPIHERVLGSNSPHTLAARANLAFYTGQAGNPASGRDQYEALIPDLERVLGIRHPETVGCRADLAHWTGEAGDSHAARGQYATLLPLMREICGADHPYTLRIRSGLARWTGEAGDPSGACDQYAALIPDLESVLGSNHPDTRADRSAVIRWKQESSKPG